MRTYRGHKETKGGGKAEGGIVVAFKASEWKWQVGDLHVINCPPITWATYLAKFIGVTVSA